MVHEVYKVVKHTHLHVQTGRPADDLYDDLLVHHSSINHDTLTYLIQTYIAEKKQQFLLDSEDLD